MQNSNRLSQMLINRFLGILPLVLILLLWQYLGTTGAINPSILPRPTVLIQKLFPVIESGTLLKNLLASLHRVLIGYAAGAFAGLVLGILIGFFPLAEKLSGVLIGLLRPIPALACIPLLILALGIGEESKIAVIMIGSFWPVLLNTIKCI